MCTSFDLTWDLVRLGNRDQISAVFTDGRLRLWEGAPTGWDARALQRQVAQRTRDAVARAPIQRCMRRPRNTGKPAAGTPS